MRSLRPLRKQGLLCLSQPQLPRCARVFERGERCGTGPAVVAGDQDDVRVGLRHTGRNGPTPTSATSLTWMRAAGFAFFRS